MRHLHLIGFITAWIWSGLGASAARADDPVTNPAPPEILDALASARQLLSRGDLAGAETQALRAVAEHPESGPSHLVLGLARFRAGRFADALRAFDDAGRAAEPTAPGALSFNRGSTLFALGRPAEAESAFETTARVDERLRAVALVNAGQAALAAGNVSGARKHADDASRVLGSNSADHAAVEGLAQLNAALEPPAPAPPTPKEDPPRPASRFALRNLGTDTTVRVALGGGFDDQAAALSNARTETIGAENPQTTGGVFAAASAELGYGRVIGERGYADVAYAFDQIAYARAELDGFGIQDHGLNARGEILVSPRLRLTLGGGGNVQLVGLRALTPFLAVLSAEPGLAFDWASVTSTAVRLRFQRKIDLDQTAQPYAGTRLDLRLSQRLRWGPLRAEASLRHRREQIGIRKERLDDLPAPTTATPPTAEQCRLRPKLCKLKLAQAALAGTTEEAFYRAPYSYRSNAALVDISLTWGRLTGGISGWVERLSYQGDNRVFTATRTEASVQRLDRRVGLSPSLTFSFWDHYDATLTYDYLDNRSNVAFDWDNKSFRKHTVSIEVAAEF